MHVYVVNLDLAVITLILTLDSSLATPGLGFVLDLTMFVS